MTDQQQSDGKSNNRDPITGAPGAHPVGTGVGSALGGVAAGAAAGTVAGPVGTVVGMAVGAVVGGLAGKGVAESLDPTREEAYWRDNYSSRPYVEEGASFDAYGPAYELGVQSYGKNPGRRFEDVEPEMSRDWETRRGDTHLEWDTAKLAARDSWDRASRTV